MADCIQLRYIKNPSEWMSNFWTVQRFKTESEPNFGFLHIPTQHPAYENIKFLWNLFMIWRGVMNGQLLMFLSQMCCHKASSAVM